MSYTNQDRYPWKPPPRPAPWSPDKAEFVRACRDAEQAACEAIVRDIEMLAPPEHRQAVHDHRLAMWPAVGCLCDLCVCECGYCVETFGGLDDDDDEP